MTSCTELVQMILPAAAERSGSRPGRSKIRTTSRAQRNWPVRLMSSTVCHWSSVMSAKAASFWLPALATRDIEAAETVEQPAEHCLDLFLARDIRLQCDRRAAGPLDLIDDRSSALSA